MVTSADIGYGITHIMGTKLYLYAAPSQARLDFLADALCKDADGLLILISSQGMNTFQ